MLTCILGLTACGSDEQMNEIQESKIKSAEYRAEYIVNAFVSIVEDDIAQTWLDNYDNIELSKIFDEGMSAMLTQASGSYAAVAFESEGKSVSGALTSFMSGLEEMGGLVDTGEATSVVDGDTIVVTVPVTGENKNGAVELIFTNDLFLKMTSCTLNMNDTKGELMARAGLNTLLGMGTVFVVLVLISFIISTFGLISKAQDTSAKQSQPAAAPVAAPAPVVQAEEEELSDDAELVAVIAAAIAAYEGSGVEGFRVRSIKRSGAKKWQNA